MRTGILLPTLALAAIALVAAWAWSGENGPAPRVVSLTAPAPSDNLAATEPGLVRIVVAHRDPEEPDERPGLDGSTPVVDVEHLGPLSTDEAETLAASCEAYLRRKRAAFTDRDTMTTDSGKLLEEAVNYYEVALAEAAIRAVERGSYLVLSQSDPIQLTLPGAELLTTGTMRGGEQVNVSIVMPLEAYPKLRQARNYLDDMQFFDDSEKARRFNALPDEERVALALRIRELQQKADKTRADRDFLTETLGFNTHLEDGGNLLFALPVK